MHLFEINVQNRSNILKYIYIYIYLQKTGFDISCKLSPLETICMECQNLSFWKKNIKNIMNLSSAEFAR